MGGHWTNQFSFVTGSVRFRDLGYLVMQDDNIDVNEMPLSLFVEWDNGTWGDGGHTDWLSVDSTICKLPIEQLIVIGPLGEARLIGGGDVHNEQISTSNGSPADRGLIRCVRGIGEHAYSAGMNRQVYRRDDINNWVRIDQGIDPKEDEVVGFECIDGFSETDIYAAGWEGEIWHYNGSLWSKISSPTNLILNAICCAGDGNVYVAGRMGLLIVGRGNQWRAIEHDIMTEDIWSLAWYNDILYISTYRGLFYLDGDTLHPVDMGDDTPGTTYMLSESDGVLWSVGKKDVMSFDGTQWVRID